MNETPKNKTYNLEQRTEKFAREIITFVGLLPKTIANLEISKQMIRSAGSVGANYLEANEALNKKDFRMRIKISRKEVKETRYWLNLVEVNKDILEVKRRELVDEST